MSYKYLDTNFNETKDPESVKYIRIEAYDIVEYTDILLFCAKDFAIMPANEFYPKYMPPRYMCTLRKKEIVKAKETNPKKSKEENKDELAVS